MSANLSRGRAIALVIGAVLVPPPLFTLLGVNAWQSLLIAAVAAGVVGLVLWRPTVEESFWWPDAITLDSNQGARRDVARLSWTVGNGQRTVGRTFLLRLHDLAERRLARLGLQLDDPADRPQVIDLLGADAVRVLDRTERAEVGLAAFDATLRRIEALDLSAADRLDRGSRR